MLALVSPSCTTCGRCGENTKQQSSTREIGIFDRVVTTHDNACMRNDNACMRININKHLGLEGDLTLPALLEIYSLLGSLLNFFGLIKQMETARASLMWME